MTDSTATTTSSKGRPESVVLHWSVRVALAVAGVGAIAFAFLYDLRERYVLVPVPSCDGTSGADSCVIRVSATPDPALIVALFVLGGLLLLLAVAGVIPTLTYGDAELRFPARASFSTAPGEREKTQLFGKVGLATEEPTRPLRPDELQHGAATDLRLLRRERDLLWSDIPAKVRTAAQVAWAQRHEDTLLKDFLEEVRRKPGQGSHAWFLSARLPGAMTKEWIRVTVGGRGRREPNGDFNEGPDFH